MVRNITDIRTKTDFPKSWFSDTDHENPNHLGRFQIPNSYRFKSCLSCRRVQAPPVIQLQDVSPQEADNPLLHRSCLLNRPFLHGLWSRRRWRKKAAAGQILHNITYKIRQNRTCPANSFFAAVTSSNRLERTSAASGYPQMPLDLYPGRSISVE